MGHEKFTKKELNKHLKESHAFDNVEIGITLRGNHLADVLTEFADYIQEKIDGGETLENGVHFIESTTHCDDCDAAIITIKRSK
jgi:hypothetical protein